MADFINSLLVDFACPRLYHTQAQPCIIHDGSWRLQQKSHE
jgi:hypothetical protein